VHDVHVSLAELNNQLTGKSTLSGFACTERDADLKKPTYLLQRAMTSDQDDIRLQATVVVDAIRLDGYPRCRLSEIANFCTAKGQACAPITSERRCFDLPAKSFPVQNAVDRAQLLARLGNEFASYINEGLEGKLLTNDALGQEVLLRLVGTTQTCAELEQAGTLTFVADRLLGCTYSCPLVLSAARGEIVLDSEAIGRCEDQVIACASPTFAPLSLDSALPVSF
jgi:hypothetical protein